jgi:hypothetical protein
MRKEDQLLLKEAMLRNTDYRQMEILVKDGVVFSNEAIPEG